MEIIKSDIANIENKRISEFLLGLILVPALLFVGFEYANHDKI